jgi:23S rRNA (pseudouridine1915-N3)-methyltransferase
VKLRVLAVGTRMPGWVRAGWEEYARRLPPQVPLLLTQIEPGLRGRGANSAAAAIQAEGKKLAAALHREDYVVALDERGGQMSTRELSSWLAARMQEGRDLAFLIGGPDGLAPELLTRAHLKWSLSKLTLPHALVRVLLAEALYRAHAVLAGHPYHRE